MTYDDVFWFSPLSHDLMINDVPAGSREPVGEDAIVSGMELVFGCTGTEVIDILRFGLDCWVVWHRSDTGNPYTSRARIRDESIQSNASDDRMIHTSVKSIENNTEVFELRETT